MPQNAIRGDSAMDAIAAVQYRNRVNNDAQMTRLHQWFDTVLDEIMTLETRHGYLRALLPDGAWASHRKYLSYGGALRDGRDFGNWGYAVVMRSLFHSGLANYDQCCDVLLGDVVEAMLHLGFDVYRDRAVFLSYATLLNETCLTLDRIENWARRCGYWESSRAMARLLL